MPKFTLFSHYLSAAAKAALLHLLGVSETASVWDIKTALLIAFIRAPFTDPRPGTLLECQRASFREAKTTIQFTVQKLNFHFQLTPTWKTSLFQPSRAGQRYGTFSDPTLKSMKAEWVGHRKTLATGDVDGSETGRF